MIRKPARLLKSFNFTLMLIAILSGANAFGVTDGYNNFKMLRLHQKKNMDYRITSTYTDSKVAVIAIHGGNIEKGTTELAYELASRGSFNYYSFEGIKKRENLSLHITSTSFDEPVVLDMVGKSEVTLSLHGCRGEDEFTYVDGLDEVLVEKIRDSLKVHGFTVMDAPEHLDGTSKSNIVNRNVRNQGVQLEVSAGLRARFLEAGSEEDVFDKYVNALLAALTDVDK